MLAATAGSKLRLSTASLSVRAQIPGREYELFIAIYVSVIAFGTNPGCSTNQQLVSGHSAW